MQSSDDQNQTQNNSNALENGKNHQDTANEMLSHPSPIVSMVSKHSNGTLNLWQLTFADKTKFSQVKVRYYSIFLFLCNFYLKDYFFLRY